MFFYRLLISLLRTHAGEQSGTAAKLLVIPAFLLLSVHSAGALDISVRAMPFFTVPIQQSAEELFTPGGGARLSAEADIFRGISPMALAGFSMIPLRGSSESMGLSTLGLGLGYSFYPIPRIKIHTAAAGGFFNAAIVESNRYGLFWSGRAEAGYRFSPGFSILGSADYSSYLNSPDSSDSLMNGLSFGISIDIALGSASSRSSGLNLDSSQKLDVFPIRYYKYSNQSFGSISIYNNESAEIRDLEVYFESDGLTIAPELCGSMPLLHRRASVEFPLVAAFGERVLEFTENAKAQGRIIVRYRLLNTRIERTYPAIVSFTHRNAVQWDDIYAAAAFASPNDAAVLDLSKYLAGLVRERIRPDIDHALQYGMGLFEGIRLVGLDYTPDPAAPYTKVRNEPHSTAYIQYPYQTFAYRSGDSDDLALLYISTLASVGLETAFVPLKEKAFAAFALDSSELETQRFFTDPSLFAWKDGKAWVIVDVSRLREGFLAAWHSGAAAWNAADPAEQEALFLVMSAAWQQYRPVGISAEDMRIAKPREDRINLAFENTMSRFVSIELTPKAERMIADMGPGGGSARQLNTLGILYAQYGLLKEAKEIFAQSVEKGSRTALVNMANISFLLQDYSQAAELYQEVLVYDPVNRSALLGLARSRYELDAYAEADELFIQLNKLDPMLADRFAYLSSRVGSGELRASSVADRRIQTIWQDEE